MRIGLEVLLLGCLSQTYRVMCLLGHLLLMYCSALDKKPHVLAVRSIIADNRDIRMYYVQASPA